MRGLVLILVLLGYTSSQLCAGCKRPVSARKKEAAVTQAQTKKPLSIDDAAYLEQAEKFSELFSVIPEDTKSSDKDFPAVNDLYDKFIKNIVVKNQKGLDPFFYKLIKNNNSFPKIIQPYYTIPTIIHQIWVGPKPYGRFDNLRKSWIANHPGWLYILWTDKEVKHLTLVNQDLYDRAKNYGEKADILRYELLYLFGGLYADIDTECMKPFDVIHRTYSFYAGSDGLNLIHNSLIGSTPHHPLLEHVITRLRDNARLSSIPYKTGPFHFTKALLEVAKPYASQIMIFPPDYFTPPVITMHKTASDSIKGAEIKPETFSVHGWAASWWGA
jgi:inositol phosphorylceramide mannosyltransferase catalytic subunit